MDAPSRGKDRGPTALVGLTNRTVGCDLPPNSIHGAAIRCGPALFRGRTSTAHGAHFGADIAGAGSAIGEPFCPGVSSEWNGGE